MDWKAYPQNKPAHGKRYYVLYEVDANHRLTSSIYNGLTGLFENMDIAQMERYASRRKVIWFAEIREPES